MSKDNILIITYSYAPLISPRAFRWTAIAEHWVNQGHCVDVVCAWKSELAEMEIVNGVSIYRTGGRIAEFLRERFSTKKSFKKASRQQAISVDTSLRKKTGEVVKWVYDHTWKKVYWPDYACLWYFSAIKKAENLFAKNHYDRLVSVSLPFTGHLVGLRLKKEYPKTKWVVDIGDPFCFLDQTPTNNQRFYKRLNYKFEGRIFNYADAIAVTTEPTLRKYAQIFPDNASKIRVVPPLLSQASNNDDSFSVFSKEQKKRLVFIGTLYKNIRSPDYLLYLFKKLLESDIEEMLELHFFGTINDCRESFTSYQALLDTKIFLHGQVSRDEANHAMKEADVLINIGNNTSYQLPSKVVEYASTGKAVLNFVKTKNDSSISFFEAYPASLCLLEDTEDMRLAVVEQVIEFIKDPPLIDPEILGDWLDQFQLEGISASYSSFFK